MNNPSFRPAYTVSPVSYDSQEDGSTVYTDFEVQTSAAKEQAHQLENATFHERFHQDEETGEIQYDDTASEADYEALLEGVGGLETYNEMLQWAAQNLSNDDIEEYDQVMSSGDLTMTHSYINQLAERYYNSNEQVEIETDEVSEYIFENVIDQEDYTHLVQYMRDNFDADTIDQYNQIIDSGNVEYIRNTIRAIQSNMGYN